MRTRKNERIAEFIILVGTPGTGKSTTMLGFLKLNRRNLILPSNHYDDAFAKIPGIKPKITWKKDPKDFKGKKVVPYFQIPELKKMNGNRVIDLSSVESDTDLKYLFDAIIRPAGGFLDGGLFIDDFKNYIITKGTLPYKVRQLFMQRRHRMLDIFMACHSFQDINADLIQYGAKFLIFKTDLPPNQTVMNKVRRSKELLQTISRVNQKAQKNRFYCELFDPN